MKLNHLYEGSIFNKLTQPWRDALRRAQQNQSKEGEGDQALRRASSIFGKAIKTKRISKFLSAHIGQWFESKNVADDTKEARLKIEKALIESVSKNKKEDVTSDFCQKFVDALKRANFYLDFSDLQRQIKKDTLAGRRPGATAIDFDEFEDFFVEVAKFILVYMQRLKIIATCQRSDVIGLSGLMAKQLFKDSKGNNPFPSGSPSAPSGSPPAPSGSPPAPSGSPPAPSGGGGGGTP